MSNDLSNSLRPILERAFDARDAWRAASTLDRWTESCKLKFHQEIRYALRYLCSSTPHKTFSYGILALLSCSNSAIAVRGRNNQADGLFQSSLRREEKDYHKGNESGQIPQEQRIESLHIEDSPLQGLMLEAQHTNARVEICSDGPRRQDITLLSWLFGPQSAIALLE